MLLGTFSEARVLSQKGGELTTTPQITVLSNSSGGADRTSQQAANPNREMQVVSSPEENPVTIKTICATELPFFWKGIVCQQAGDFSVPVTLQDGNTSTATLRLLVQKAETWFPDKDGDGFGNGNMPAQFCHAPQGYVRNHTDCNDSDPSIGKPQEFFVDEDLDGFGSETAVELCSSVPLHGYSAVNTDCDDHNASVNPKAARCRGINNELNAASVTVFPNTGTGLFTISVQKLGADASFEVYNTQGVQVWTGSFAEGQQELDFNIETQPAGIYWLKCRAPGFSQNLRLVKQ